MIIIPDKLDEKQVTYLRAHFLYMTKKYGIIRLAKAKNY